MKGVLFPKPPSSNKRIWFHRRLNSTPGSKYLARQNHHVRPGDDRTDTSTTLGLPVAVVSSAADVYQLFQVQEANVGSWLLAVAYHDFPWASAARQGFHAKDTINSGSQSDQVRDAVDSPAGNLIRKFRHSFSISRWHRRSARLVLYCKFPGAIIECPMDGTAFELVQQSSVDSSGQDVELEAQTRWMLPRKGFDSLRDVEDLVIPGISALAREMAADSDRVIGGFMDKSIADKLACLEDQPYLVAPHPAGITVLWGGAPGTCYHRMTDVRFSKQGQACTRCLLLENKLVADTSDSVFLHKHRRCWQRRVRRCVSLPISYSALIREARAICPRNTRRWQCRNKKSRTKKIIPGIVEDQERVWVYQEADECACSYQEKCRNSRFKSEGEIGSSSSIPVLTDTTWVDELTPRRVESISWAVAAEWASTRGLIRMLLGAACRKEADSRTIGASVQAEGNSMKARRAAKALLAKATSHGDGNSVSEDGESNPWPTSTMLDEWYESFWAVAVPLGRDQGLLQDCARSLLVEMLDISIVRIGFLCRGLLSRLASGLLQATEAYWTSISLNVRGSMKRESPRNENLDEGNEISNPSRAAAVGGSKLHTPQCASSPNPTSLGPTVEQQDSIPWRLLIREDTAQESGRVHETNARILDGDVDPDDGCETASEADFTAAESTRTSDGSSNATNDTGERANTSTDVAPSVDAGTTRELESAAERGRGYGKKRATPPILRLDVLKRDAAKKGRLSPRPSPQATVTLSAASTRVSVHQNTFTSARGATSRCSGRITTCHHSGGGGGGCNRPGQASQREPGQTHRSGSIATPRSLTAGESKAAPSRGPYVDPRGLLETTSVPPSPISGLDEVVRSSPLHQASIGAGEKSIPVSPNSMEKDNQGSVASRESGAAGSGRVGIPLLPLAGLSGETVPRACVLEMSGKISLPCRQETIISSLELFAGSPSLDSPLDQEWIARSQLDLSNVGDSSETLRAPPSPLVIGSTGTSKLDSQPTVGVGVGGAEEIGRLSAVEQCHMECRHLGGSCLKPRCGSGCSHQGCLKSGNIPAALRLVLKLARGTATPRQSNLLQDCRGVEARNATAQLLTSLLPAALAEENLEVNVGVALRALAGIEVLSWVRSSSLDRPRCSRVHTDTVEVTGGDGVGNQGRGAGTLDMMPRWNRSEFSAELASLDIKTLVRCMAALDESKPQGLSSDQSLRHNDNDSDGDGKIGIEASRSNKHRDLLRALCRQALEHTWLARLLTHKAIEGCPGRGVPRSVSSSVEDISRIVLYCGVTLARLLDPCGSMESTDSCESPKRYSADRLQLDCGRLVSDAGALLIEAPVAHELTKSLESVLRWSRAWGEDFDWSASTLSCMASSSNDIIPTLVRFVSTLMKLISKRSIGLEISALRGTIQPEDREWARLAEARSLARALDGSTASVDDFTLRILECLEAALYRSASVLNASRATRASRVTRQPRREHRSPSSALLNQDGVPVPDNNSRDSTPRAEGGTVQDCSRSIKRDRGVLCGEPSRSAFEVVHGAVARVLRAMIPLIEPDGCALAALRMQRICPLLGNVDENESVGISPRHSQGGFPSITLPSTLRLIAALFPLWSSFESQRNGVNPEIFVDPLFHRLATCLDTKFEEEGVVTVVDVPEDGTERLQNTSGLRIEGPARERRAQACGLHLDALRALVVAGSQATMECVDNLRVVDFLLTKFLCNNTIPVPAGSDAACLTLEGSIKPSEESRSSPAGERLIKTSDTMPSELACHRPIGGRMAPAATDEDRIIATTSGRLMVIPAKSQAEQSVTNSSTAVAHARDEYYDKAKYATSTACATGGIPADLAAACHGKLGGGSSEGAVALMMQGKDDNVAAREAGAKFVSGDKVDGLVAVKMTRPRWFPGSVTDVHEGGSLDILYDDGDVEKFKNAENVRPRRRRARVPRLGGVAAKSGNQGLCAMPMAGVEQLAAIKSEEASPWNSTSTDAQASARHMSSLQGVITKDCREESCLHRRQGDPPRDGCSIPTNHDEEQQQAPPIDGESGGCDADRNIPTSPSINKGHADSSTDGRAVKGRIDEDDDQDDMCFTIPSVLSSGTTKASPPLVRALRGPGLPPIDLQSPLFGSRIRSSHLGPGSSLSTPTAGDGGGQSLRDSGGSCSDGAMVIISARALTMRSRRPSAALADLFASTLGMSSASRKLSSLFSSRAPTARDGRSLPTDSMKAEITARSDSLRLDGRQHSQGALGSDKAASTMLITAQAEVTIGEEVKYGVPVSSSGAIRDDENVKKSALLLLLAIVSMRVERSGLGPGRPDDALSEAELEGDDRLGDAMMALQDLFQDEWALRLLPCVGTRWLDVPPVTAVIAILVKLTCAALFDDKSYSLDGDRIAAGTFGGIVASRSPVPIARKQATSVTGRKSRIQEDAGDAPSPREVALKIVDKHVFDTSIGANAFKEVLALCTLENVPWICRLYDFGVTPTSYVFVMERCDLSLKAWRLARSNDNDEVDDPTGGAPRSAEDLLVYLLVFRQIAAAIAAMAERGVIHCDLKCDNILVRREMFYDGTSAMRASIENLAVPSICIADFGEAVVGRQKRLPDSLMKSPNQSEGAGYDDQSKFEFIVSRSHGTERIQSPEMLALASGGRDITAVDGRGSDEGKHGGRRREQELKITPASDVWSLGCLLYELLCGRLLFESHLWSEFFVILTSAESLGARTEKSRGERHGGMLEKPPLLPPPAHGKMRRFFVLCHGEPARKLLMSILIRDPVRRPTALRVLRDTDEVLSEVHEFCSSEIARTTGGAARQSPPEQRVEAPSVRVPGAEARPGRDSHLIKDMAVTMEAISSIDEPSRQAEGWGLEPCEAVRLYRAASSKQIRLQGCEGYVCPLGGGGFLLTMLPRADEARSDISKGVQSGGSGLVGDNELSAQDIHEEKHATALEEPHCLRPNTCISTVGDISWWRSQGIGGSIDLENLLLNLGITHVVCVTPGPCAPRFSSVESEISRAGMGLSRVGVRVERFVLSESGSVVSHEPGLHETSAAASTGEALLFMSSNSVLFVGNEGDGGVAGGLAIAWAASRSGRGVYETILDFRQSCSGFWVDPSVLELVLGSRKTSALSSVE